MLLKKRKKKLTMLMGTMTKRDAELITLIDHDDLIIAFAQQKNDLGSNSVHVICLECDAEKIYKLFNEIRKY